MRSDRVVLPESMCAEMPMLRMMSMFATSVSALLEFSLEQAPREREFPRAPPGRGRAPYPERGERQAGGATPVQAVRSVRLAESLRCRRAPPVAPLAPPPHRARAARVLPRGRTESRHLRRAAVRLAADRGEAGAVGLRAGGADAHPPELRLGGGAAPGRGGPDRAQPVAQGPQAQRPASHRARAGLAVLRAAAPAGEADRSRAAAPAGQAAAARLRAARGGRPDAAPRRSSADVLRGSPARRPVAGRKHLASQEPACPSMTW